MNIKNTLYYHLVDKNALIKKEYEGYNIAHIEEHRKHRWRSWLRLIRLNIKYNIFRAGTSDSADNEKIMFENEAQTGFDDSPKVPVNESRLLHTWKEIHMIKRFIVYDYVVFNLFDTLIYRNISDRSRFFDILGERLKIPKFSAIREKAEKDLMGSDETDGIKSPALFNIYDIYDAINKELEVVDVDRAVAEELDVLSEFLRPNPYLKTFYDMLSYSYEKIVVAEDTYYSSDMIREILNSCGYTKVKEIFVSNETGCMLESGDMIDHIKSTLETSDIIIMDDRAEEDLISSHNIDMWKYWNADDIGAAYRIKDISSPVIDAYNNIVNQHMYCGHFQHSLKREVGFKFFGLLSLGFINWIKYQADKKQIDRLFFLETESEILTEIYDSCDPEIPSEKLFFSEEMAVRCLMSVNPKCFIEYYIEREICADQSVSYYIKKMSIDHLMDELCYYGLDPTDIISIDSRVYKAFSKFLYDNKEKIHSSYRDDIRGAYRYLRLLDIQNEEKIGIVDADGKGNISQAIKLLLKEDLSDLYIEEFSLNGNNIALKGKNTTNVNSYLKIEKNGSEKQSFTDMGISTERIVNVFYDCKPRFRLFHEENWTGGTPFFEFNNALVWEYGTLKELHYGISDFCHEYISIWKDHEYMMNISCDDVYAVLRLLSPYKEYIDQTIPELTR